MFQQVLPLLQIGLLWAVPHIPALALYSGWAYDREPSTHEPGLQCRVQVPRIYRPSLRCRLRLEETWNSFGLRLSSGISSRNHSALEMTGPLLSMSLRSIFERTEQN